MKVKLKRTFVYRGRRFRRGEHDLPDEAELPRDAELVEPAKKPKAKAYDGQEKLL